MLETLTLDRFLPLTETLFLCRLEDGSAYEMRLVEATGLGKPHHGKEAADWPGGRQPFSLVFVGSAERALPQSIYALEHATLGALSLFLVPIGRDATGTRYQAIFS